MANTRQSTKRAHQAQRRQARNVTVRSTTRSVLKTAVQAITKKGAGDSKDLKAAYMDAVKALSKAASKGALPKGRAARKISRLTRLAKKTAPAIFS